MTAVATASLAPAPAPSAPAKPASRQGGDRFADEFAAAARAQATDRDQSAKTRRAQERRADARDDAAHAHHAKAQRSQGKSSAAPHHDGVASPQASAPGTRDSGTESQAAAATAGLPPVDDSAVTA
ncbi:hypothetical protein LGT39_00540, partial [Demequina sp. TTPB684]|nr:hypothetical protein [Demequina sp. TTPB684]